MERIFGTMWIARDKNGVLKYFDDKPVKDPESGCWHDPEYQTNTGNLDPASFPGVTWNDSDPTLCEIVIGLRIKQ